MQMFHGRAKLATAISLAALLCGGLIATAVNAQTGDFTTSSKLLLTGGITNNEGSAGGGLTPWAVIGG